MQSRVVPIQNSEDIGINHPFTKKRTNRPISLKKWRPITLLNCDYKIATESIASRMRQVLPRIIKIEKINKNIKIEKMKKIERK